MDAATAQRTPLAVFELKTVTLRAIAQGPRRYELRGHGEWAKTLFGGKGSFLAGWSAFLHQLQRRIGFT
jgi:hypothetical protein